MIRKKGYLLYYYTIQLRNVFIDYRTITHPLINTLGISDRTDAHIFTHLIVPPKVKVIGTQPSIMLLIGPKETQDFAGNLEP